MAIVNLAICFAGCLIDYYRQPGAYPPDTRTFSNLMLGMKPAVG
jgi:hypothetical protein